MSEDEIGRAVMERAWEEWWGRIGQFRQALLELAGAARSLHEGFMAGYEARGAEVNGLEAKCEAPREVQRLLTERAEAAETQVAALTAQVAALEAERAGLREALAAIASCPGWINSNALAWQKCRVENQWLDDDPSRCYHGRMVTDCEKECPARIAFRALATDPARAAQDAVPVGEDAGPFTIWIAQEVEELDPPGRGYRTDWRAHCDQGQKNAYGATPSEALERLSGFMWPAPARGEDAITYEGESAFLSLPSMEVDRPYPYRLADEWLIAVKRADGSLDSYTFDPTCGVTLSAEEAQLLAGLCRAWLIGTVYTPGSGPTHELTRERIEAVVAKLRARE